MWLMIMLILLGLALLAVYYLLTRFHRFSFVQELAAGHRALSWLVAFLPLALLGLFAAKNVTTLIVVLLHLTAGFLLCGLIASLTKRLAGVEIPYDIQGAAAIVLTAVYLSAGWYMAHHVFETDYRFETGKPLRQDFRIAALADSHLGVTLDGEAFAREMRRIQELQPDAVAIVGDFVDDSSKAEDMIAACKALGELNTAYGVFYVYGNHDKGYYHNRDFSPAQLRENLENNGVVILEDESVPLGDSLVLIGRKDRSDPTRKNMAELAAWLDPDKVSVVLDHQPNDYDAEADSEADLVVSGHTHGGQMIPFTKAGEWTGAYERAYGYERRKNTDFLVTSGIADWVLLFKTGTKSEYVIVNVTGN
jgi:predicted MPP superfamily phosphohydrolase